MQNKTTLLFLLLILADYLHAADPKFYVMLSPETKANSGCLNLLDSEFFNGLRKKFPCASSESQYSTMVLLDWEKQKQILGVEDKDQLLNIAEAMKYDYLVSLSVTVLENTTTISAFIMKNGPNNVISRTVESVPIDDAIDAAKRVAKKLIDDLYQYNSQLCREKTWTGTIKIEQHTYEKLLNADDPARPGGSLKSDLSVQCEVNNNVAQCTVNYSEQLTGAEGNSTTVASGSDQTDVSISVFEGKTSISVGMVKTYGTCSGSLEGGGGFSSEITMPLGGWSVDAAIGTSTRSDSSSGSVNQGDLTITWSLNKK
ncbi:MAG: hypothetical protein Q7U54_00570 [Bacteroidales bacterium]|nr:hypothetical protein [Bacteroidales bacterium]